MSVLRLAIQTPLRRLFDYLPPANMTGDEVARLAPGQRLRVPFGNREVTGVLLEVSRDSAVDPAQLKPALALLDPVPLLPPDLMDLCLWAASYYQHPPGEVFAAAFPAPLRRGRQPPDPGVAGWRLTDRGQGLPADALPRAPRQGQALALLRDASALDRDALTAAGVSRAVLRELETKGLVERCSLAPADASPPPRASGLPLNPDQRAALEGVQAPGEGFSCHLLDGVTGSGKTEVYLQLIDRCLAQGKQALVLVPEIGLSPQTLERFRARFDASIEVLHSGLSEGPRSRAWEAARRGHAHIIIGTRSAVFTPLRAAGLVIVDEEHDASYKQQDGFRYSARDVAVKRAQLLGCPVVLGSATPSLESLENARRGRYHHHRLPHRAGGAQLPRIQSLDVRREPLDAGCSPALLQAVDARLQAGEQVLLFLNRRGFAPSLQCHDCGWLAECSGCDARLTVHLGRRQLRCHHCSARQPLPHSCPACHGRQLLTSGVGTEQAEATLRRHFDPFPIYRVDSDSMQGQQSMEALTQRVNSGAPCLLLGTQMLTKGHHFPGVSLVAVIDADALLFSADFRGEERMAQLLTQVAGRAGRAERPGEVLLQTHHPDHPAVLAMLHQDYASQAGRILQERERLGLPPFGQLVLVRCDCVDAGAGEDFLGALRQHFSAEAAPGCALLGPLPAPMPRRQGRHRSQLLLQATSRRAAGAGARLLVELAEALPRRRGLNWSIDVDPIELA